MSSIATTSDSTATEPSSLTTDSQSSISIAANDECETMSCPVCKSTIPIRNRAGNKEKDPNTSLNADAMGSSDLPSTSRTKSTNTQFDETDADDTNNANADANGSKKDYSLIECNICLDTAKEPVNTMCGHLFCWPCLYQWLETRPTRQLCPICKAAISKEKVFPLYGRGSTNSEDPRSKIPPRPAGQRTEPEPNTTFQGFGFGDGGFQMSLGIGAFPFGIFTSTFNFGTNLRSPSMFPSTNVQFEEDQFLSKVFLYCILLFLAWLILA